MIWLNKCDESIEKYGGILVFDYVGDLVNVLVNKPKLYRISYDPQNDVYGLADAYKYTHCAIADALFGLGYKTKFMSSEEHNTASYYPYDCKLFDTEADDYTIGGFVGERGFPTYITTGVILTYEDTLEEDMPDLYRVLTDRGLLISVDENIDRIRRSAKIQLNKLRNQIQETLREFCNKYDAHLVDQNFSGVPNFESFIKYWKDNESTEEYPCMVFRATDIYSDTNGLSKEWIIRSRIRDLVNNQNSTYEQIKNLCEKYNIPYSEFYDL